MTRLDSNPWSLRIDGPASGAVNMARDLTLLDHAERTGATTLRLYRWSPHCLSLGRNEPALRRYDRARIEDRGLDTVRRPTGGRAVWHGRELTYAVTAPLERFGGLAGAYREIHELLADALRLIGAEPVLAAPPGRVAGLTAGACFATASGGELMIEDQKIVGSAQLTQGNAFLQHGSVLLEDGQSLISELSSTSSHRRPAAEVHLTALIGRPIGFDELSTAVCQAAGGAWGAPETTSAAGELLPASEHLERFSDPGWTWRR